MKRQKTEDVEIPITPMLDMAFQLLTFFILTYTPAPAEGQFSMNLLPAQPAVAMDAPATDAAAANNDLPAGLKTLPVILRANDDGTLGEITLGENNVADLEALAKEVKETVRQPDAPLRPDDPPDRPEAEVCRGGEGDQHLLRQQGDQDRLRRAGPRRGGPAVTEGRPGPVLPRRRAPRADRVRGPRGRRLAGDPQLRPPQGRGPRPPPPVDPRPLEPDTSLAFKGLADKTPMGPRDNAAYKTLLDRARETPPDRLAKDARRDVFYTHLWERPDLYRGVPVHLEGTLLKVVPHPKVDPVFSPKEKLVEAWFTTPESRPLPYVAMIEDVPPGLPIGADLNERVAFDGYFLKLLRYVAGDADRAAPLLIGRLRRLSADGTPAVPAAPAAGKPSWNLPVILVVAALAVYVATRVAFQVRRVLAPHARRPGRSSPGRPTEEIAPEALSEWLASVPEEGEGEDDEPGHARPDR